MPRISKQPRIEPLEPPYDEETSAALELLGPPIQLFRVLARRPELARGIAGWGQYYLSRKSALSLHQRELVIDRTTARCGADYEWGIHVAAYAEKVELTQRQLDSLATGDATDACWTLPADRAVINAVDELHTTHDLSDPMWSELIDTLGQDGALEITLLTGWYHAISYAVLALRLPLEPGTTPIPN
jgi:alkylhydroperoxidase family enzyme